VSVVAGMKRNPSAAYRADRTSQHGAAGGEVAQMVVGTQPQAVSGVRQFALVSQAIG
jgi:hypothetical protein